MKKSLLKYLLPVFGFSVFVATIFVWSMALNPGVVKKQMVICYKFNSGTTKELIDKHISDFQNLKRENSEIANYSAGLTVPTTATEKPAYDVMHYLTFKTLEDIEKFKNSITYKKFVENHKSEWQSEFVLNAEIK